VIFPGATWSAREREVGGNCFVETCCGRVHLRGGANQAQARQVVLVAHQVLERVTGAHCREVNTKFATASNTESRR